MQNILNAKIIKCLVEGGPQFSTNNQVGSGPNLEVLQKFQQNINAQSFEDAYYARYDWWLVEGGYIAVQEGYVTVQEGYII